MPRKKNSNTLENKVAELQGQLTAAIALAGRPNGVKAVVGIRNISNTTVGMINKIKGEEGEVSLHAERFGIHDPATTAVISEAFWRTLRKEKLVGLGIIMRDDSVCSGGDNVASPDRDEDLAPGRENNIVVDPFQWIESKTEDELRTAISKMDSDATLRRLAAAVTHMIWKIGEERYKDHDERARLAIRDCPAKYHWVDTRVEERLDELNPNAKDRANERKTVVNFRG